jgi:hypothetical protein
MHDVNVTLPCTVIATAAGTVIAKIVRSAWQPNVISVGVYRKKVVYNLEMNDD